jgi:iron(III) transport system ATP-binding protein
MAFLKVERLQKSYGSNRILDAVSLEIERGQFVSLLGPSGSGKTTALRCVAGLERPDGGSGRIELDGLALSGGGAFVRPEERSLGMVFQNYAVWPHLDVFENVAFPLRVKGVRELRSRVAEALALVKLTGLEKRYSHELSGGQQQRVALARALVMSPKLLLLDEPLSNLDALLREELGAEIRALQQRLQLTTILVTHDRKEALSLSDRVIVLDRGRIEADGEPEALYRKPPSPFVAEFLAGGQRLGDSIFLPRQWALDDRGEEAEILSRLFLGGEYEYLARSARFGEPLRFFAHRRFEAGERVSLRYSE